MGTLQSIGYIANMEKLTKQDLLVISAYATCRKLERMAE